jgi:hypothetical protein
MHRARLLDAFAAQATPRSRRITKSNRTNRHIFPAQSRRALTTRARYFVRRGPSPISAPRPPLLSERRPFGLVFPHFSSIEARTPRGRGPARYTTARPARQPGCQEVPAPLPGGPVVSSDIKEFDGLFARLSRKKRAARRPMARRQALYLEMLAFEVLLSCRDAPTGTLCHQDLPQTLSPKMTC